MFQLGLRSVALTAAVLVLSGCKMSLTNRVDVQGDGSAIVHVTMRADDQLYSLVQSQGTSNTIFSGNGSETEGDWTIKRSVTDTGDHIVDASTKVASLDAVPKAFDQFYSHAFSSASPTARGLPVMSPQGWHFRVDRTPGLFTDTIHVHADVPKLIPDEPHSSARGPWAAADANLGRAMMSSILTVNTELKLPGTIKSSNGTQMVDGTLRFNHPLLSPSSIDIVDEVPDVAHILLAVFLGLVPIGGAVFAALRKRVQRPAEVPASA